jgi:ribonucleoside-diphosphate reductase alpha chain
MSNLLNPAYIQASEKGALALANRARDGEFYINYSREIVPIHQALIYQVTPAQELAMWPMFSLAKIKLFEGETLTDLLLANAIKLALKYVDQSPIANVAVVAVKYYNELASKRLSLASPFFNNLRKKGVRNLSSCFIAEVGDSLESIMKSVTYAARISKAGGGFGCYLGKVRGKGSDIGGNKNAASSIMSWVRLFDQVCVSVNQLGQRPGAITVALPIWHIDIEEFLDCQTENGDLRAKAYNIQPQVCVDDYFMQAVEDNLSYALYCPKDLADNKIDPGKDKEWHVRAEALCLKKKDIKARKLWANIQEKQLTLGRPYLFFTDNAQINSPFKKYGNINSGNLCQESYSYFEADRYIHCCNLISVNLTEHESLESISTSTALAVEMADLSLSLSQIDIPEAKAHVKDFRTIGVGLMGLADWLAKNEKQYSDLAFIELTQKTVTKSAYRASVKLAKLWGHCPANPNLESELWDKLDQEPDLKEVSEMRARYGIRNAMMLATAPNTSTSLTMGSTASFLPPYSLDFIDESEDHSLRIVTKYKPELYVSNQQMPQEFITDCTAVLQKWIDAGLSMEYLLPYGASWSTNKSFSQNKVSAWKQGVKAIYYVRTTEQSHSSCVSCAN